MDSLRDCFFQLRKEAAPGVDGVTFEEYVEHIRWDWLLKMLAHRVEDGAWLGLIGNSESLHCYWQETTRLVFKWLNRRGQRRSYRWRSFWRLLQRFQIPAPRLRERAYGGLRGLSRWTAAHGEESATVNLLGAQHVRVGARTS